MFVHASRSHSRRTGLMGSHAFLIGLIPLTLGTLSFVFAADPDLPDGTAAAKKAMAAFRVPEGMRVELFAAEPKLASPVAIGIDERGGVFVAEEYRFNRGTEENRTRPFLLDDDLQIETVEQRRAMFEKYASKFTGGMEWFRQQSDQVRVLRDTDGDGVADVSKVFAAGFNDPLDGLAAGVMIRDGRVYFTCIPHLWLLRDADGDDIAEHREPLLSGFGVNAAFLGHDLHGLVWGPDGRLYFSVGDRGFHVTTKEGTVLSGPRTGAVFRCQPDGSELEVVARGLRNPQEIAFDQYGRLFAADNNCDKGDHSRLVYVLDGGDSGWNMAYQSIAAPYLTGPWHAEQTWHAHGPQPATEQPAWIVPPVGPLGAGPSGFAYYPGTGLASRYAEHFFMCNYTGNGGIESFALKPRGAGFEIVDAHDFLKPIKATDLEFGYDGKVYVSDFVNLDWTGKSLGGRIYTLHDPREIGKPAVRQTRRLFAEGFRSRSTTELLSLLFHVDMRVRQRAQFALVERGEAVIPALRALALGTPPAELSTASENTPSAVLPRLHALWSLGMLARKHPAALAELSPLLADAEPRLRANALKTFSEAKRSEYAREAVARLSDSDPEVRLEAALACGRLAHRPALDPLFQMLADNGDRDPFLRHAGVMGLFGLHDLDAVAQGMKSEHSAVRMAVLLVLRRARDPRVAAFFKDPDLRIVTEAARAAHDTGLDSVATDLASLAGRFRNDRAATSGHDALWRRIIAANFRLGGGERVRAVLDVAVTATLSLAVRREALDALRAWDKPSPRDRVTGVWRPVSETEPGVRAQEGALVREQVEQRLTELLASTTGELQTKSVELIAALGVKTDPALFTNWALDAQRSTGTRLAAVRLLAARRDKGLPELLAKLLGDGDPRVRAEARTARLGLDPTAGLKDLASTVANEKADAVERQLALRAVGSVKGADTESLLKEWFSQLEKDRLPGPLQVDLIEAIQGSDFAALKGALTKWEQSLPASDALAKYRPALVGGDAERGRDLFVNHRVAQCLRCHKVQGTGGDAGPDLSKVSEKNPREHLLESLIVPDAKISLGFGTVTLILTSGKIVAGVIKSETPEKLVVQPPMGEPIAVKISDIDERTPARSPMPTMSRTLTLGEMRDLIEYLSRMK